MDSHHPDSPASPTNLSKQALTALCRLGREYRTSPEGLPELYLAELRELVRLPGRVITNPYGRAHIYEFFIQREPFEHTIAIEISAVAPAALFQFIERHPVAGGWSVEETEVTPNEKLDEIKQRVITFLHQKGYSVLPLESQDVVCDGRSLRNWLFYDPAD